MRMLQFLHLNKDIIIEILSRLSAKDLIRLKCTCKNLNNVLSDLELLRAVDEQSKYRLSGYIVQVYKDSSQYLPPHLYCSLDTVPPANYIVEDSPRIYGDNFFLDRVIMSTNNGIICCRNLRRFDSKYEIFIVSPMHPTRIAISGPQKLYEECFAFAFFPLGCSSKEKGPSFRVVNIHSEGPCGDDSYYFSIYSSETGKWRHSRERCRCEYLIRMDCLAVFANGKFYWLTKWNYIISFDAEEERSNLIQLPAPSSETVNVRGQCLGESQGRLHYVLASYLVARVWVLEENNEPKWLLKHHLDLSDIAREAFKRRLYHLRSWEAYFRYDDDEKYHPQIVCFSNDVLGILLERYSALACYNLRTGESRFTRYGMRVCLYDFLPALIPYSFSLTARKAFQELIERPNARCALASDDTLPGKLKRKRRRRRV